MKFPFLLLIFIQIAFTLKSQPPRLSQSDLDKAMFPDGLILRVRTPSGEVNIGGVIHDKLDDDTYRIAVGPFNTLYTVKISSGLISTVSNPSSTEEGSRRDTRLVGIIVFEPEISPHFTRYTNVVVGVTDRGRSCMGQITRLFEKGGIRVELYGEVYHYLDIRNSRIIRTNIPGYRRGDFVFRMNIMQEAFRRRF